MSSHLAPPSKTGQGASPRYTRRANSSHNHSFYSTTSGGTTSYDTVTGYDYTRDDNYTDREDTLTEHDATRPSHKDVSFSQRDVTFSRASEHSVDSRDYGRSGSYYPEYEKNEWSCGDTGGWQKLSVLLLALGFLGHVIAVTTPYWKAGYINEQMVLHEGIWMSCYQETTVGRWICATYDVVRKLNNLPFWYQAAQILAVLGLLLLLPTLVVVTPYTCIPNLRRRSQASWAIMGIMTSSVICSFLSIVVFGGGYPSKQAFPPGDVYFHFSYALQIIAFIFTLASLLAHVRDSYPGLKVWGNLSCQSSQSVRTPASSRAPSMASFASSTKPPGRQAPNTILPPQPSRPLSGLVMLKIPSALSRFSISRFSRSKSNNAPPEKAAIPTVTSSTEHAGREVSADKPPLETLHVPKSDSPSRRVPNPKTYRSYNSSSNASTDQDSLV